LDNWVENYRLRRRSARQCQHASFQGVQAQNSGVDVTSRASSLPIRLFARAELDQDPLAAG